METKNYNLVTFFEDEDSDLYLVDMKRKKILLFQMYHTCQDVTAATKRMYETDKKKDWSNRRIGCDLIDMMNHRSYTSAHIILATDDAREMTRKIAAVRAKWFASRACCLESQAKSELAGWSRSTDEADDDNFVSEQFKNL